MDHVTKEKRSKIMAAVHSENTKPEILVRKLVYAMGHRYRLHDKSLPGKPDLVFKSKKKAIFVNGCFWHGHDGCEKARLPKTRVAYWRTKIESNKLRDNKKFKELTSMGWRYLIIWQCNLKNINSTSKRIIKFLEN